MVVIERLIIYPVKSCKGINVEVSKLNKNGLYLDRLFTLIDKQGNLITSRNQPKLITVEPKLIVENEELLIELTAENMKTKLILNPKPKKLGKEHYVDIWGDKVQGYEMEQEASNWFSDFLSTPVTLLIKGEQPRKVQDFYLEKAGLISNKVNSQTAFSDGFPLLILSLESLEDFKNKLASNTTETQVSLANFRPNIVLQGVEEPFAEDYYSQIKIGDVLIHCDVPRDLCIVPNVDPITGIPNPLEPSKTLMKVRRAFPHLKKFKAYFGVNAIPINEGTLKVGQQVEIISTLDK